MAVVFESNGGERKPSAPLDVDLIETVHQNVGNRRLFQQRLQGAETKDLVQNLFDNPVLLGGRHRHALVGKKALDDPAYLRPKTVFGKRRYAIQVEHADKLAMNLALEFEHAVR